MGIESIDSVLNQISSNALKDKLEKSKDVHSVLTSEIHTALNRCGDEGKDPNPIAKGMSWLKTNAKLAMNYSDNTIADLMTEGCNMGVKSLGRYLNEYKAADEESKDIAKRLIRVGIYLIFKKLPSLPKSLYHFTFLLAMYESSS